MRLHRHLFDIKTALANMKAPTDYNTFVPLSTREFTRSTTTLLFNPLLYIGSTAFPFIKKVFVFQSLGLINFSHRSISVIGVII